MYDAREATNALGLVEVDTMSWWCGNGGGSTAGIAFVGSLCSSYNINLNEKQSSIASSGYVSATKSVLLFSSFMMICLPKSCMAAFSRNEITNIFRINKHTIYNYF